MPLVVSSLMGDASDVFDWILSLNPGNTQDLTTLLQMLKEHYCGSLTFREQRNTIENLCQRPQEAAVDFLIRVGTSVSNLGKDWKDELTERELQSLQYEVSLKHLRAPHKTFKTALHKVLDKKATAAYVKLKEQLLIKNGLLYRKTWQGQADEIVFQFIVPQRHQGTALDCCHQEVAHQGQRRSTALMQEHFWWPGMTRDLRNCIKKCGHCRKYEAAPPVAPMKPLTCSGPGELLHVDFTSTEETVPLKEDPVIRNVLVLQDHFSKYIVAYVVKDQTACTAAETLRNGYFHKTMAFAATIAESEDDGPCHQESSSQEGADPFGAESSQEDDERLFIPSYLEEALPYDPVLQVKMAHAMWAQEVEMRRCFTCNQQGHLQRDHWKYEEKMGPGPCSQRGLP